MDWKALTATVAPWIATALGGPAAGMAVRAVAAALGVDAKTTEDAQAAILGATPDQLLALKKADQDFAVQMQSLGFKNQADLEKIAADDRASARAMQLGHPSFVPAALSLAVVVGFFGELTAMMVWPDKSSDSQVLNLMLGTLGAALVQVMNYWFGSTAGSMAKSQLLAQSTPAKGA